MQEFHFPKCDSFHGEASLHSPHNQFSTFTFNVHHRGEFRRLCTACVLKFHITHFCPICYQVYDDKNPQPTILRRVRCADCTAIAHSSCLTPANICKSAPYQCPRCEKCDNSSSNSEAEAIDRNVAKQLMAAAKIAAATVMKAEKVARAMAEKRAEEAVKSRKQAVEAMEKCQAIEFLRNNNNNNSP